MFTTVNIQQISCVRTGAARRGFFAALAAGALLLSCGGGLRAQTNVTTQHNDIARSGANTNETILTPANVNNASFGKLFSYTVDGRLYAQPLYVAGVTMGAGTPLAGTTHNVVIASTENDSVYAFDADSNAGGNGGLLWQVSLIDAAHAGTTGEKVVPNGDVSTGDIVPIIGITGTGVIDPASKTLYVVAKSTIADTTFIQRLHAIDMTTGLEKFGGPVTLSGSVAGTGNGSSGGVLNWDPKWESNRAGLLLLNGIVYIGFAAHGDNGPWHGWILAYSATTLAQTGVWCTSPNGIGSGAWMSGSGLAADLLSSSPYGRMFVATGNGDYTSNGTPYTTGTPYTNTTDYGDSIVRLDLTNGVPTVSDDFTPWNQASLNSSDSDTASGGVLLLPDQTGTTHVHELVQVGKDGNIHVVDRDTLGGYNTTASNDSEIVQEIGGQTGGLWSMPAYWNGSVYFWGNGNNLKAFSVTSGKLSLTPTSTSSVNSGFPGATPAISSSGTSAGIVWALRSDSYNSNGPEILYAFDATNVATEFYDSTQKTNDGLGAAVKFVVPTITNGKVYVGDAGALNVFGLLGNAVPTATPVISPAGQSFTGSLAVSITDSTPGATIYCTTNGTQPAPSAADVCPASIAVTSTETIQAVATAPGAYLESALATQSYTLQTQTLAPTFSPVAGSYISAQTVSLSDGTSGATIYYTTDGSVPPASPTTRIYNPSTPIVVSGTETITAVATSSTLTNSPVVTGLYTIVAGGTGVNYSNGFSSAASTMTFNGSTDLDDTRLQLTNGGGNEASSAFVNTPVNIQSFTTDFAFQLSNPSADGFTFTIQGDGPTALGASGGSLGYAGIAKSVAVKFDLYNNSGEGADSTGLYTNGAQPTTPAVDMTSSGINLHSGDTMSAHLAYNGTTLALTINDAVAGATFTTSWTVNIPGIVGGNTAYIGFTGGTGGLTSSQKIETWTFVSGAQTPPAAATPTFSLAAGTYLGAQMVSLSDSTTGATIYYTLDGSTPSASSTIYAGTALVVSATETINAIAIASGYSQSAMGSATYVIESQVAAPAFTPGTGSYLSGQTIIISSITPGATIYYNVNSSSAPTTSSTPYTGAITLTGTETIQAIATESGYFNSNVASATFTVGAPVASVNLGSGFSTGSMKLNGNAVLNGTRLRLTDTGTNEASSAWYPSPVNIGVFSTSFTFQNTGGSSPQADGFAFVMQGNSTAALGPSGGGLGYGPDNVTNPSASTNAPIAKSVAVKFDLYSNAGEGVDSTGIYVNGASPSTPFVDLTSSGINLHSTDIFSVSLTYDGTNLTLKITDATTLAAFTQVWPINIPATVGGNAAFVGFTGGTGGDTAIQEIIGWTLSPIIGVAPAPTFSSTLPGTYTTAQSVSLADSLGGATIYYTTNGTAPTTSSAVYSAPIAVSATTTITAIAASANYSASPVTTGLFTITPPAAAPMISPATGTYSGSQPVTITDSTTGATIHYTIDGSSPSASSPTYSTGFTVNATTTVRAIAVAPGYSTSAISASTITIAGINYSGGFTSTGLTLNGSAAINGTRLRLTNGSGNEAASAWTATPLNVQTFTSDFTFQLTSPNADGFMFVVQNAGPTALGPDGGSLGYAKTVTKSVGVKFDLYNNGGEGTNSTGLYLNGANPSVPAVPLGGGVNLHSGDIFQVHMTYDGTTLIMKITDTVNPLLTFTNAWTVNIPGTVGANTAYVGFTAGTGGQTATQDIVTWAYNNTVTNPAAIPTIYETAGLTAVSSGPTFRTFTYSNFPDTTGTILDATKVGDNVTFTVNVATAGTYDLRVSYKKYNTRGIWQLTINGANVGSTVDEYLASDAYAVSDLGNFTFPSAGNYAFKFTVTGKDAASSSYGMSFDDFTLTAQ